MEIAPPALDGRGSVKATANILGVIPARLAATRLPGKPLLPIAGVAMLERVYRGAAACRRLRQVWVATDADEIARFCQQRGMPCQLTSAGHNSGTDRVWEVAMAQAADAVVNIQGDEPMVRSEMIDGLIEALFASDATEVSTLCTPMAAEEVADPSAVKVVTDAAGRALYFSRAAIPYARSGQPTYRKHLGFYAYSRAALDAFHGWPPSELEQFERLEQLRFLHHGVAIAVAETPFDSIGVDTPEDLERVDKLLRAGAVARGGEGAVLR